LGDETGNGKRQSAMRFATVTGFHWKYFEIVSKKSFKVLFYMKKIFFVDCRLPIAACRFPFLR
jgi:hypothetical protein